jgi:hypothetical protein
MLACIALVVMSSTAIGIVRDAEITPEYIAQHKGAFKVETTMRDGNVEYKVIRFASERRYWIGKILIRKNGRTIAECELRPLEEKTGVRYEFTLSREVIPGSTFILSENGLSRVDHLEVPEIGGTRFHFRLQDYFTTEVPAK